MKKKLLIIIILISFFQLSVSANTYFDYPSSNLDNQCSWTVLFYLAADNPRSYEIDNNLDLWKSFATSDQINLIALVDGSEQNDTSLYQFRNETIIDLNWLESESDMGDKDTLFCFLNTSLSLFPAEHYALFIMSTHGSGWQGLGSDTSGIDSYEKLTLLDLNDYKQVLENIQKDFSCDIDVIAFDICVTGMIEVAYQIKDYCTYMIGTEEHGFSELAVSDEGVHGFGQVRVPAQAI